MVDLLEHSASWPLKRITPAISCGDQECGRDNRIAPINIFRQRSVHRARKLTNLAAFDIHFVFGASEAYGIFGRHICDLTGFSGNDEYVGGDCFTIGCDDDGIDVE